MQETWIQLLGQEDPLEEEMATLQYSCLENSVNRGCLEGYCLWGCKKLDITEHIHKIWETREWRRKKFDVTSIKK